jgi:hypothetical protein
LDVDCSNGGAVDIGNPGSAAPGGATMTTYANAAPPPGALFDNAPVVEAARKYAATFGVSEEYAHALIEDATLPPAPTHTIPATRIAQGRNGKWYSLDVLMQYGRPVPLTLALRRVSIGRTVFVAREDAGTVMEAVGGTDGEGS